LRQTRAKARLARRSLPQTRREHISHDNFVHFRAIQLNSFEGFGYRDAPQPSGSDRAQSTVEAPDGSASSADDDGSSHQFLQIYKEVYQIRGKQ